jgi:hypothetical protein
MAATPAVRRHLPLGGAVNTCVGPALFPTIQIGLRFLQTLEVEPFEWSLLRVTDAGLDFAFPIRVPHATRQGKSTIMPQHIAVERIERGIVDIWCNDTFAEIIEHHHARHPAQSAKRFLVQLGPHARTGSKQQ